jgi:hypothetical protein
LNPKASVPRFALFPFSRMIMDLRQARMRLKMTMKTTMKTTMKVRRTTRITTRKTKRWRIKD